MFCIKCGKNISEDSKFCEFCGAKIEIPIISEKKEKVDVPNKALFYGRNWSRVKSIEISSVNCDILITDHYLFLIKLPKFHSTTAGSIIGLLLFNIIGVVVGSLIGNSKDRAKMNEYRSAWIDGSNTLISEKYLKDVMLKIPREKLKTDLEIKKNKMIVITETHGKLKLTANKKERERFSEFMKTYL